MTKVEAENLRFQLCSMAATAKLIEFRIAKDISATEAALRNEEAKVGVGTGRNSAILGVAIVGGANNMLIEKRRRELREEITKKKQWLELWLEQVWAGIAAAQGKLPLLQAMTLEECLAGCARGPHGDFERFAILQEAVLAPVYGEFAGLPKGLKEMISARDQAQDAAVHAGFPASLGKDIYQDSDKFIKGAQEYWKRMLTTATVSAVALTVVSLAAAPALAAAIGGLSGLSGAAAVSHGLALMGGGSLAAGGLGMQGGLVILGATGGAFGASGGAKVASAALKLDDLSKEAVTIAMCKTVNYLKYLGGVSVSEQKRAQEIRRLVINGFLDSKHSLEKEVLINPVRGGLRKGESDNIRILQFTFLRMTEIG